MTEVKGDQENPDRGLENPGQACDNQTSQYETKKSGSLGFKREDIYRTIRFRMK